MLDTIPTAAPFVPFDEVLKTEKRYEKRQATIIKSFGYGLTAGGVAVSDDAAPRLIPAIVEALKEDTVLTRVLRRLEPELIAACCLSTMIHGAAEEWPVRMIFEQLGINTNHELWARGLVEHDKRLAARIEGAARKRSTIKHRRQAARSIAKRLRYDTRAPWGRVDCVRVGEWLANVTVSALTDVFEWVTNDDGSIGVTVLQTALDISDRAARYAMQRFQVYLPCTTPPLPWNGWATGGSPDRRARATLLRSHHRSTAGIVKAAVADGTMKPALDALNAIQAVPWVVNTAVLDVIKRLRAEGIEAPGLPRMTPYAAPAMPKAWEDMEQIERTLWKIKATTVKRANQGLKSDTVSFDEDMATAEHLAPHGRFYTPCNCDWRGRVYPLPHFNFQREDRVRALFLFADGAPIGEEGLHWLKVHVANYGDFDKVSKRPFEERVAWVDKHLPWLTDIGTDPFSGKDPRAWQSADKPFLFLAASVELTRALATGPAYVSRLPVSFDGSCSGLQHLCAMTRAAEGRYVNLTPNDAPEDVYARVADAAAINVMEDAAERDGPGGELARLWQGFGVTRSVVKRNVMTYSYSSKKFGMARQQDEDTLDPLGLKVMAGELDEHPFNDFATKPHRDSASPAAQYIAEKVYGAIEQIVEKPAKAMAFLQKLARALAHEGKPLAWTTPVGIPWVNRYHEAQTVRVKLWLHDNGVKVRHDVKLATGHHREIDKTRASNGVAPNFVHACDGAHLMLVVLAAEREGFKHHALVHDSFGCLASEAPRIRQIIREQFVAMYEQHDVLGEVLARAAADLTEHNHGRLPEPVEFGPLNIKDVLNAEYAFA